MENVLNITDDLAVARFEPEPDGFGRIADEGFRSLVSLQTKGEDQKLKPDAERRLVEKAGLTFYHQDVSGDSLSDEAVDRFRAELERLPRPVLLHCASGKRSGAMTMMHVGSKQGMSGDQVIEKAESMGFECDTPELEDFVRSYVDRHSGD